MSVRGAWAPFDVVMLLHIERETQTQRAPGASDRHMTSRPGSHFLSRREAAMAVGQSPSLCQAARLLLPRSSRPTLGSRVCNFSSHQLCPLFATFGNDQCWREHFIYAYLLTRTAGCGEQLWRNLLTVVEIPKGKDLSTAATILCHLQRLNTLAHNLCTGSP